MSITIDHPSFWDEKYVNNETYWDLKSPSSVWQELLEQEKFIHPCKLLILGSGKGYDAILAAKLDYQVTAVDFSAQAILKAKDLAKQEKVDLSFLNFDIFNLDEIYNTSFDAVFEYVTYCAINPERRNEYIKKICSLIRPGGKLIALLFPIDDRKGGPPFSVDSKIFYNEVSKYLKLEFFSKNINSIKPRRGKEVLQIFVKPEQLKNSDI